MTTVGKPVALDAASLAEALRAAVLAQDFDATRDPQDEGRSIRHFPSIDLAVVAFPERGAPVAANVLFSREFPEGLVADIAAGAGAVRNIRFLADQRDAEGNSIAWRPASDWSASPQLGLLKSAGESFEEASARHHAGGQAAELESPPGYR